MKILTRFIVLLYVTLMMFLGAVMVLFANNLIVFDNVVSFLRFIYSDETLKLSLTIAGFVLLFINFIVYRTFSHSQRRDRIVAFDNPAGRVSVSLIALEDLLERRIEELKDVKEVKLYLRARRRSLEAKVRISLRSEVSIPETISQIQDLIRRKVQDTIGIEETVQVIVHVGRIVVDKNRDKKDQDHNDSIRPSNIPFQGYRA